MSFAHSKYFQSRPCYIVYILLTGCAPPAPSGEGIHKPQHVHAGKGVHVDESYHSLKNRP